MRELDEAEIGRLLAALEFQPQAAAPKSPGGRAARPAPSKPSRQRRGS
jgi:hypothetical protein